MTKKQINYFMREAMMEGKKALPTCLPNPPVGCVIVKNNHIIARGFTNSPGQPHAEAMALNQIPVSENEVSIFVTLEPCSFFGRTPSCAKEIAKRKIKEVYVGILDPHKKNQGKGIIILENSGVKVKVGILAKEIKKDLSPYLLTE